MKKFAKREGKLAVLDFSVASKKSLASRSIEGFAAHLWIEVGEFPLFAWNRIWTTIEKKGKEYMNGERWRGDLNETR